MPTGHTMPSNHRMRIPKKYKDLLPYTWYALQLLRRCGAIDWLAYMPGIPTYQPYLRHFDDETRNMLKMLSERHNKTPSCILATALRYYDEAPRAPVEPRGLLETPASEHLKAG